MPAPTGLTASGASERSSWADRFRTRFGREPSTTELDRYRSARTALALRLAVEVRHRAARTIVRL